MVKVMYNDQLVYKVVIWVFFGISLWTKKVALNQMSTQHFLVKCHTGSSIVCITIYFGEVIFMVNSSIYRVYAVLIHPTNTTMCLLTTSGWHKCDDTQQTLIKYESAAQRGGPPPKLITCR